MSGEDMGGTKASQLAVQSCVPLLYQDLFEISYCDPCISITPVFVGFNEMFNVYDLHHFDLPH